MDMMMPCLAELLKETKKYDQDEFRIVVVGDIFHAKIKEISDHLPDTHGIPDQRAG